MFWGLIMDPNKRYTQTVEKAFHVSMASLDTSLTTGNEIVQVKLCYEGLSYLLCNLQKGLACQVPLDLNFQEGTEISFTSNGKVHLTGYLIPEENIDMDDLEEEEEDEEEEEEIPQLVGKQSKRKAQDSPKDGTTLKKLKAALDQEESSDDDLENDDDLDESLEMDGEADDDSDDGDDDEEEEDDSEEEEEVEEKPPQKKSKKEQKKQANAKQEKQKLVNGKDAKPEMTKQEKKKAKAEAQQQQQQQKKLKDDNQQQQKQNNSQQVQKKRVVEGGVQIEDVRVGTGANAKPGKFVSVYYIGRLTNGKKFDATQNGDGFKFRLGKGEVIKGWDVGIAGMKIGGKRRITIPPGMAYGARGSPPVIPGNSTLVFEVELKNVH